MSDKVETIVVCVPVTLEYDSSRVRREYLVAEAERGLTNALQHLAGHYRIEGGEAKVSDRRWVSVSERLPLEITHGYCLVTDGKNVGTANYSRAADKFYHLDEREGWEPTHWMPLPEPPKEGT